MKDKRLITFVRCVSESKVISAPPPLLKGGVKRFRVDIEVGGRDGTLGFKPQKGIKEMRSQTPPPPSQMG